MTPVYYSDFVGRFDNLGVPYKVREDVDAIRMEFKMPLSRHEILCSPAVGFHSYPLSLSAFSHPAFSIPVR